MLEGLLSHKGWRFRNCLKKNSSSHGNLGIKSRMALKKRRNQTGVLPLYIIFSIDLYGCIVICAYGFCICVCMPSYVILDKCNEYELMCTYEFVYVDACTVMQSYSFLFLGTFLFLGIGNITRY